ncbi:hypothetical protein N9K60_04605 [Candidatus Poseidoniales archaeon]|nr:hypothetical protein [Candidatus Poseidoniales archaeon]
MAIEKNQIKTSLFLTLLMILTPFAAASTVTTFSDGSSEVVIEFKDGVNSVNTTDGSFYIPNDETVTSASVDILSAPKLHASDGAGLITSYSWDSNLNNGATVFDDIAKFSFSENRGKHSVQLTSESLLTDFEINGSEFDNTTNYYTNQGSPVAFDYGYIPFKSLRSGPDGCASGDMCWGTNIYDQDYTDDLQGGAVNDAFEMTLTSPVTFLDSNLNDTYLRYSSWHSFEAKYNTAGDYYYDDCAFVEIIHTPTGQFSGEEQIDYLPINLALTTGLSPGNGIYIQSADSGVGNRISPDCYGIEPNQFAFAATSVGTSNPTGWTSVVSNLAPYLGSFAKIRFTLIHSDISGNIAPLESPGWYIDDFSIGERYPTDGIMVIENIPAPSNYSEKSPNGYGLLYLDTFEPADSSLKYSIKDSVTGVTITSTDGFRYEDLTGSVLELWDIDTDMHQFIDIEITFDSGSDSLSTPIFHGFTFGTEFGLTFNDYNSGRGLNLTDSALNFEHNGDKSIYINSSDLTSSSLSNSFSKPIYELKVSDLEKACVVELLLNSISLDSTQIIIPDVFSELPNPIFDFNLEIILKSDCTTNQIWITAKFGHHLSDVGLDYGMDGFNEWEFNNPGYGMYGLQHKFYAGESNSISQSSDLEKMQLDPITGEVTGSFFLLPKDLEVNYFDLRFGSNSIFNINNSVESFSIFLVAGSQTVLLSGDLPNREDFYLHDDIGYNTNKVTGILQRLVNDITTPVIKTDDFGIDWVRVGFKIVQTDSNNGGSADLTDLIVIYNKTSTLDNSQGFGEYIKEYVATSKDPASSSTQSLVPVKTVSSTGGMLTLSNLSITTQQGYESTLIWENDVEGLYSTGEIYSVETTHEVSQNTGASLAECRIKFKSGSGDFYLGYDLSTGFYELGDDNDYISIHPSSSVTSIGSNGGKQVSWKFTINPNWDDESSVVILSETVADNGIVGMLSGKLLNPDLGNAVENDVLVSNFTLFNSAGEVQDLVEAYSNQEIRLEGNISLENVQASPNPTSYYLVVEERGLEIDGAFTNITWTEIANRSGVINGYFDWNVNLGLFASGSETYRFRMVGYEGGDIICPPLQYSPDSDCGIQFNLSIDILDPNLKSVELYKRNSGEGDINSDDNWRQVFDDSWATPKLSQDFRFTVSDIPTPPESGVMHVWVQYDHDSNSNGLPESSEYVQIGTTVSVDSQNATFSGTYNDFANSGLKGKVSLWIECYDLAGNSVDGGSPGFDNDYVTYVSMDLEYPTINSLKIEDSFGIGMVENIPSNPPEGVGVWNQTMFAGNEYNIIIDAEDGNGWKDVEFVEVILAPQETNYDSKITYYPRNQTAWTNSDMFSILENSQGESRATIRTIDDNTLLDPFEPNFIISVPISFDWGLPLVGEYTPSFQIKDLDNSPVFSESSFRQTWIYENDMRLDFRSNLDGKEMISPTLTDQDVPISENLYHEIGQDDFIGSVTGGDNVLFQGQYSFTSGILENVFIRPEVELTMEITRKEVFRDAEKDYDSVDEEITTHTFTGGSFEIPIKMPSYQNEFEYTFRLINLPIGADDLTSSYCFGSNINGCSKFVIKVDDEAPKLVFGSWTASRGENTVSGLDEQLFTTMPTSTFHCVDVSSQIEERGSISQADTSLNWMFYDGDPTNGNVWSVYQDNYGTQPLTNSLNLTGGSLGYVRASADCVDLWPVGIGQFDVTESDLNTPGLSVNLVMWVETQDGAGSPIIGAGRYNDDGTASGIEGSDTNGQDSSTYMLEFEGTDFNVRNIRTIPESPEVGDKVKLEVELVNSGIPGVADLEIRSVINNGVPAFEGYIVSEVIGENQAMWVSIELAEFTDATTGMYYIVYDNETGEELFNGKDQAKTFNVKASSSDDSGISTGLIVIILIAVIAILAVAVVVISRRNNDGDFDELYDDEDDKSYASIPATQSYSAPVAQVSPEMAEAMEKFTFWTQEEIQGYFDQGWNIQQLEEWLESQ